MKLTTTLQARDHPPDDQDSCQSTEDESNYDEINATMMKAKLCAFEYSHCWSWGWNCDERVDGRLLLGA